MGKGGKAFGIVEGGGKGFLWEQGADQSGTEERAASLWKEGNHCLIAGGARSK